MRLIDADALIEFCAERWIPLNIDAVNMQPTIQPENAQLSQEGTTSDLISKTETAKRIVGKSRDGMTLWYQCDMCNEPVDAQDNYCRGCGRRLIDG